MTAIRDTGAVSRSLKGAKMRDAGGVARTAANIRVRDAGNVLRTLFSSGGIGFSASVSPGFSTGYGYSPGFIRITTSAVTVTIGGGTPPYTITWIFDDGGWDPLSPTQTTGFRSPTVGAADAATTNAYATVTDSLGSTANTAVITLTATNTHP